MELVITLNTFYPGYYRNFKATLSQDAQERYDAGEKDIILKCHLKEGADIIKGDKTFGEAGGYWNKWKRQWLLPAESVKEDWLDYFSFIGINKKLTKWKKIR